MGVIGFFLLILIYVSGVITAFGTVINRVDEDGIDLFIFIYTLIFSLFSWVMVLAIYVGDTIKKLPNDNDEFQV